MREDYTSPDQSNAITLDEFMVYVGMGEQMTPVDIDSCCTMLLRATINKLRMVISNAEDTLNELSAKQNRKAKAEFVEYLKTGKRGGDTMAAKKVSKAVPKKPAAKGKIVKKK